MKTNPNRHPEQRPEGTRVEGRWPLAIIITVALQAAGALLWAGQAAARIDELQSRIEAQAPVAERLARLEEQAAATRATLDRIEAKLDRL